MLRDRALLVSAAVPQEVAEDARRNNATMAESMRAYVQGLGSKAKTEVQGLWSRV